MTYAIGHIVYGVNLTQESFSGPDVHADIRDEIIGLNERQHHVETRYSGSGDEPAWFGIENGEIDECNAVDGHSLIEKLTITDKIRDDYKTKLDLMCEDPDVTDGFKEAIRAIEPKCMILWGSS